MNRAPPSDVVVLLSTFNGARFLTDQIESIAKQSHKPAAICVRDDGSQDATVEMLRAYRSLGLPIQLEVGTNTGACASYFELLRSAPDAELYMFADQDDVWYRDKIARAVTALSGLPEGQPAMYFSRMNLINDEGVSIGQSPLWPRPPSFANALAENIATGCTIALNRPAVRLLRDRPTPQNAVMHDWWSHLVVSAFGRVVFDPKPTMSYRIHGANTVGLPAGRREWVAMRWRRGLSLANLGPRVAQALEFGELYGDLLTPEDLGWLDRFVSSNGIIGRVSFAVAPTRWRQYVGDDVAIRLLSLIQPLRRDRPN